MKVSYVLHRLVGSPEIVNFPEPLKFLFPKFKVEIAWDKWYQASLIQAQLSIAFVEKIAGVCSRSTVLSFNVRAKAHREAMLFLYMASAICWRLVTGHQLHYYRKNNWSNVVGSLPVPFENWGDDDKLYFVPCSCFFHYLLKASNS